jgi:hypothetical protein
MCRTTRFQDQDLEPARVLFPESGTVVRLDFAIGAHYAIQAISPANEKTFNLALFGTGFWQSNDVFVWVKPVFRI